MTPDDPHPVTCPKCGAVIGCEDEHGLLVTAIGLIAHAEIVHSCGKVFYWHVNMQRLARLIDRR